MAATEIFTFMKYNILSNFRRRPLAFICNILKLGSLLFGCLKRVFMMVLGWGVLVARFWVVLIFVRVLG